MKQRILSNWNFIRFFRLVLGVAIIVQSLFTANWAMGIIGVLFTSMPVLNIGCCGTASCAVPGEQNPKQKKDIPYEEVI